MVEAYLDSRHPEHSPVGPLPPEVLTRLQEKYTDAAVGLSKSNPIEVFSEISGISNLSSLLLYPDTVNDIYGVPVGTGRSR